MAYLSKSYRKNPESIYETSQARGRPSYSIDASYEEFVRAYIRKANVDGSHITLEMIQKLLFDRAPSEDFHLSTLARTLDRWGFEFGKGTRTQHLKEKNYVILARQKYLRKIRSNRSESKRPEVYLDESYVNKNHSNDFIWYYGEDGPWVQKPPGKGGKIDYNQCHYGIRLGFRCAIGFQEYEKNWGLSWADECRIISKMVQRKIIAKHPRKIIDYNG